MYAVSYVFQRFQPCRNHSKAFHAIQCQNVGYIIDIWGILGHYLVFYYESNWESSVKALVVCCATYGGSGNIASRSTCMIGCVCGGGGDFVCDKCKTLKTYTLSTQLTIASRFHWVRNTTNCSEHSQLDVTPFWTQMRGLYCQMQKICHRLGFTQYS